MSKTQVISTKVTPEKRQEIEAWAKSKGKSVSDYMQIGRASCRERV